MPGLKPNTYTPAFNIVVEKAGAESAYIYGCIFRFFQDLSSDDTRLVYQFSVNELSEKAMVNRRKTLLSISKLEKEGFVSVLAVDKKKEYFVLRDGGKVDFAAEFLFANSH